MDQELEQTLSPCAGPVDLAPGLRRGPDGHGPASCAPVSPVSVASLGGSLGAGRPLPAEAG